MIKKKEIIIFIAAFSLTRIIELLLFRFSRFPVAEICYEPFCEKEQLAR